MLSLYSLLNIKEGSTEQFSKMEPNPFIEKLKSEDSEVLELKNSEVLELDSQNNNEQLEQELSACQHFSENGE